MNPAIDFRAHDQREQGAQVSVDGLDFDLTGFHAVADYIRQELPKREEQPGQEAMP